MLPAGPSFPKERAARELTLGFPFVADPEQFNHGVGEGEATICRALAGMLIWRALRQTELNESVSLRGTGRGANEKVVEFDAHAG